MKKKSYIVFALKRADTDGALGVEMFGSVLTNHSKAMRAFRRAMKHFNSKKYQYVAMRQCDETVILAMHDFDGKQSYGY